MFPTWCCLGISRQNCTACTIRVYYCRVFDVVTVRKVNIKIIITVILFFVFSFHFPCISKNSLYSGSSSTLMYPCPKNVFDLVEERRCNMLKALN